MKYLFQVYCCSGDENSVIEKYFFLDEIEDALTSLDSYFSSGLYCFCGLYLVFNPNSDREFFRLIKSYEL